jgi:hypothetical protein
MVLIFLYGYYLVLVLVKGKFHVLGVRVYELCFLPWFSHEINIYMLQCISCKTDYCSTGQEIPSFCENTWFITVFTKEGGILPLTFINLQHAFCNQLAVLMFAFHNNNNFRDIGNQSVVNDEEHVNKEDITLKY